MSSISPATVDAAVRAVRRAAIATRWAQGRLVSGNTLTKSDDSPVTVADFAAQAIVCNTLAEELGDVAVVGEETPDDLVDRPDLLDGVASLVAMGVGTSNVTATDVIEAVGRGASDAPRDGTYWTLDPIDGTKGFVRGDQYAIALALIEGGRVVFGVLGCPNLPNPDGTRGALLVGSGEGAVMYPLDDAAGGDGVSASEGRPIRVDAAAVLSEARFCESVESGHSDQTHSVAIAQRLGITAEPYRIDSQCKYAAVARGDASIYLRLPTRADYVEKIWDHAAGKFVVECAGGVVTDVAGAPLDFSHGKLLQANRGVVATNGRFHEQVLDAVGAVLDL
ncbi:3'(2'),5'-bisphosphate nucleotidase [Ilumatobacter coccineus]|uniref:Putative 3'(2'),5'-bisphosphate nucleotidase n=1 Tax=Ilumatobacter coccineus (strain NBRC 103263 / KCTC 29153 / YM16-304) TaxID=1313172 RepID=A0A6C7EBA5_ILUCY|nr:3'(2'),5'-bisphosphate nucleotidase [Ilumatobacter coccineus]BAN03603.1 putative 3'(2'),5'-bisphosphate nucleotidase [Ilumatobacter coccineus YM16-304]